MNRIIKLITIFIFIMLIGASILYVNIFPLAIPIELPMENEVYAIEIKKENIVIKYIDDIEIVEILEIISNAKPTRRITAHEIPMVREYITINFNTKEDRLYTTYIYNENSKWYIEQPYIGVYEIKKGLIDFISYIEDLVHLMVLSTIINMTSIDIIPSVFKFMDIV